MRKLGKIESFGFSILSNSRYRGVRLIDEACASSVTRVPLWRNMRLYEMICASLVKRAWWFYSIGAHDSVARGMHFYV